MSNKYISAFLVLTISGLGLSPSIDAQDASCSEIDWKPEILERIRDIDRACQEVVLRDGKWFARFEAKVKRVLENGSIELQMLLRDGSRVDRIFHAPDDFRVVSHTGRTNFRRTQLVPGEHLDIYIPESRITVTPLGEPPA
jgi:hypothetical protein